MSRQTGHDLGYFVRVPSLRTPPPEAVDLARSPDPGPGAVEVPFVRGSGPRLNRIMAVLYIFGGIFGGLAVFFGVMMLSAFFGMWGSDAAGDFVFAVVAGCFVAVAGIAIGIVMLHAWRGRPAITVSDDVATIRYPGFKRPLIVPRDLVRVVAVDSTPAKLFHNNKLFPIEGPLPEDAFADVLVQYHRPPWEPRDAEYPSATTGPTVPGDRWPGSTTPPAHGAKGYLYGNGGTALHVLRVNAEDIPNVAVIFHEPIKTPGAPLGFHISNRCGFFLGGRKIRGFMARVEIPGVAEAAFRRWDVVRPVTASDVLEEGLRVPKPLAGWRAAAYVAVIVLPMVIRSIVRWVT